VSTFATITAADWRTAIARARSTPNSISQQIRKQLTPTDAGTRLETRNRTRRAKVGTN
jgi:hypothetical protein